LKDISLFLIVAVAVLDGTVYLLLFLKERNKKWVEMGRGFRRRR